MLADTSPGSCAGLLRRRVHLRLSFRIERHDAPPRGIKAFLNLYAFRTGIPGRLAKDGHMVQALPTQRADKALRNSILPWRSREDRPIADTYRPHPRGEDISKGAVVVAHQVS
jgi:hypothetical protein